MPKLQTWLQRFWASFSYVGLAVATLFFAASLTPSLLPRNFAVQGILSGFALAVGYGVGVFFVALWLFLEIPKPGDRIQRVSKQITTIVVALVATLFLWRATIWQNSIRQLMEMEPVETAYPWRVGRDRAADGHPADRLCPWPAKSLEICRSQSQACCSPASLVRRERADRGRGTVSDCQRRHCPAGFECRGCHLREDGQGR